MNEQEREEFEFDDGFCSEQARATASFVQVHVHQDIEKCACGGSGWILGPCDSWEGCPIHPKTRHPEDDSGSEADYEASLQEEKLEVDDCQEVSDDEIPF